MLLNHFERRITMDVQGLGSRVLGYMQRIGRALMLPVAVLPAAAILMGVGYWIVSVAGDTRTGVVVSTFLLQAGAGVIDFIPLLFAAGVAYGLAKKGDGAAAIAGVVGYLVLTTLLKPANAEALLGTDQYALAFSRIQNALIGILSGIIGGHTFNRFSKVELPLALAFFSGKRLVPIVTSFIAMAVAIPFLFIWPIMFGGLVSFGEWMAGLGAFGAGLFGFFNRLLIPLGLHHALNAVFWFDGFGVADLVNFLGQTSEAVSGVTGRYMAGYFPIFMFGLPGAALAMVHTAKPENRLKVSSIMIGAAFASFFTGITEPIEFSFLFLAPLLYLMHAVLTGISMFIAASIPAMSGFGFSAGIVDLLLQAQNPLSVNWWLLPIIGVGFFGIYYYLFRFTILKFDLPTPGRRESMDDGNIDIKKAGKGTKEHAAMAVKMLSGLGGASNVVDFGNCVTRLRVQVADASKVNRDGLIKSGATEVLIKGQNVQVIVGVQAQFVATAVEELL